ncbi:hypothetical protein B0H10DRAFT_2228983 [Mycena sp. CBHHK59/15]|nr:hypothetical protein B0H10DRAFT_2228983 [Mycena sp. CBHHK59/15]
MSTSTQALGRGIRKLAALFGEVSAIVTDAEAYELDPYPDDDDIDELSPDLTEAELKHLEEKREETLGCTVRQIYGYGCRIRVPILVPNKALLTWYFHP